jgi:hypothetical protein
MGALKHFIGCIGIAITLDYFAFDGYCTVACTQVLSLACDQMLFEVHQFIL